MKKTFDLNLNSADLAEADEATKKGRKPVIKGWHFSRYGRELTARRGRERLYMSVILDPWCGFGEEYIRVLQYFNGKSKPAEWTGYPNEYPTRAELAALKKEVANA